MRKKKTALRESAIKKTAAFLGTEVIKEETWTWNVFGKSFRYLDKEGRRYRAVIKDRKEVFVSVLTPPSLKKSPLHERSRDFVVSDGKICIRTDRPLVLEFIASFFNSRQYHVSFVETKGKKVLHRKWQKALMLDGEHLAEIEIVKTSPLWEICVKDAKDGRPYFCTQGLQYKFKLKPCLSGEAQDNIKNLLVEYEESETEDSVLLSPASVRKAVYGFHSPNIKAFYSDDGIFPEVQHAVKLSIYSNLAIAIINASVFVRVAERLQGNTWYTLAAGVLVFIRAPAEVFYMKKSLGLSRHLPSTIVKDAMESEEFKELYENKHIRGWSNFEKKLYDTVRKKDDFVFLLERYGAVKAEINGALKGGNREKVLSLLEKELNFTTEDIKGITKFTESLMPVDVKKIKDEMFGRIENLLRKDVLKHDAGVILKKYIEEIFPINLLNNTFSKTFKLLKDRIKQEERVPSREEVSLLVSSCKQQILPFRIIDIMLFLSLYSVGYAVTFMAGLPELAVPFYYIFYGAAANVINAAVLRIGSQASMQYIYRNLGNAPTITSAADAWNEYNSHLMRIWAVFSSIGLIIGITGKLFSSATYGISRYAVEIFALFIYIKGFREWHMYYTSLENKIKTEE